MAALLYELRRQRGISLRQLADEAGVSSSVAHRAEGGRDVQLSTWGKLFQGLGYELAFDVTELAEEIGDLLSEEHERRVERRLEGLCTRRRRCC